ncbi:MAG: hypothetical protein HKP61_20500, partial [Dactylosporangium sp.]|nr:hypothetical protein [Dactylosporangium sp.]NNJ63264.1 hypothetical protein [Dactylosporangium sp.]
PTTGRPADDPLSTASLVASGVLDVASGQPPVPIDVWRVADDAPTATAGDHRCTTRMAALLISLFTVPGDVVVSVGFDPALAGVAGAAGLAYRSVDHPADLADLDHLAGGVGLLLLPWPPTADPDISADPDDGDGAGAALVDWLAQCRRLLAHRGVTVVALAPAPPTDVYVACARLLLPAARRAGLGWLQHIVAITAPVADDAITHPAASEPPAATGPATPPPSISGPAAVPAPVSTPVHADLIALALRGGRHG